MDINYCFAHILICSTSNFLDSLFSIRHLHFSGVFAILPTQSMTSEMRRCDGRERQISVNSREFAGRSNVGILSAYDNDAEVLMRY